MHKDHEKVSQRLNKTFTEGNQANSELKLLRAKQKFYAMKNDATLLSNRIQMLQAEENKLMKKIQNTWKRADEILEIKWRNEQKFERKVQTKQLEEQKVEKAW